MSKEPVQQSQLRIGYSEDNSVISCAVNPAVIRLQKIWRSKIKKYEQQFMGPCVLKVPKRYGLIGAVASEQNQHCGGEARPQGPKLEARRAEPGVEFLGRGAL